MNDTNSEKLRWFHKLFLLFAISWIALLMDGFTGHIIKAGGGYWPQFNTATLFGIPFYWTPGTLFMGCIMVAYLFGYKDVLALREDEHGI